MSRLFRCSAFKFAVIAGTMLAASAATAQGVKLPEVPAAKLLESIRAGGYVLFIRHGETDKEGADQVSAVMGDCSTQRTLSEKGWKDMRTLGAVFAKFRIPVATVVSSEYCRAWQSADLAFGRHEKRAELNFEKAEKYTDAQTKAMKDRLVPLLAAVPQQGRNSVLVGHDDPFEAATGHYPEPQGKLVVLKPDGKGGFALVGGINPDAWVALSAGK